MAINFVVQQIDPLFGCDLSFENNIVTIKTSIDDDFVFCIVILESPDLGDPPPFFKSIPVVSNKCCTAGSIVLLP